MEQLGVQAKPQECSTWNNWESSRGSVPRGTIKGLNTGRFKDIMAKNKERGGSMKKSVLGRGLSSLLGEESLSDLGGNLVKSIPISSIRPNPHQPRSSFDESTIKELARSIETSGLMQPIVVCFQRDKKGYILVSGERRLRAVKLLGWEYIPAMIREIEEKEMALLAVVENVQREDISPIDEARIYKRIIKEFSLSQDAVASLVGKSRSHVANMLRLLSLPEEVQEKVKKKALSFGQARELLSTRISDEERKHLAEEVVEQKITVKEISKKIKPEDPFTKKIEEEMQAALGTKVKIEHNQVRKKGKIVIEYYSLEELDRIADILKKGRNGYEGSGFSVN